MFLPSMSPPLIYLLSLLHATLSVENELVRDCQGPACTLETLLRGHWSSESGYTHTSSALTQFSPAPFTPSGGSSGGPWGSQMSHKASPSSLKDSCLHALHQELRQVELGRTPGEDPPQSLGSGGQAPCEAVMLALHPPVVTNFLPPQATRAPSTWLSALLAPKCPLALENKSYLGDCQGLIARVQWWQ